MGALFVQRNWLAVYFTASQARRQRRFKWPSGRCVWIENGAQLVALARQTGRRNCTFHNLRFYPLVQQMRRMREAGDLGEILLSYLKKIEVRSSSFLGQAKACPTSETRRSPQSPRRPAGTPGRPAPRGPARRSAFRRLPP